MKSYIIKTMMSAFTLTILAAGVQADYPNRNINYFIPFNPGGESDVTARMQEEGFKEATGQGFTFQYRAGAGGATGWSQLNQMTADGYNIMGFNLPHLFLQPMSGNVGYETDDIEVVYVFQLTPHALIVPADSPIKSADDFISRAKENPGALTVAGVGTNSAPHIAKEIFDDSANTITTYIPFTGTSASTAAMLGAQVDAQWSFITVGVEQQDNVRLLGVALEERHPLFPDVPTFREMGIDLVDGAYRGVAVPKTTPEDIKIKLSSLLAEVNKSPSFRQTMEERGFVLLDVPYSEVPDFMERVGNVYIDAARLLGLVE